jgi:hypothetical protein
MYGPQAARFGGADLPCKAARAGRREGPEHLAAGAEDDHRATVRLLDLAAMPRWR